MGCSSSNASRENEVDFPQDYEELAKQISELKIRKDMGIIIAIDVKDGKEQVERKQGEKPVANTIEGALNCCGEILGEALAHPYFFGSKESEKEMLALRPARGSTELVTRYHQYIVSQHSTTAALSIKPVIARALKHVDETSQFHLVVIFLLHDIDAESMKAEREALSLAARYPLSIVFVKVGKPPSANLTLLASASHSGRRFFSNTTLVPFDAIAAMDDEKDNDSRDIAMAFACMARIPSQYQVIRKKLAYMPPADVPVFDDSAGWERERRYQESLKSDAKILILGRNVKSGIIRVGRGAWWHPGLSQLYYTDLLGKKTYIYEAKSKKHITIASCGNTGFVVPDEMSNIYVGTESGIEVVRDLQTDKINTTMKPGDFWIMKHCDIESSVKERHITCGTTDSKGRIWVCTGSKEMEGFEGGIWCCHGEKKCIPVLESVLGHIAGMAFSGDMKVLYLANQVSNTIWAYDHDIRSGIIENGKVIFEAATNVKGLVSDVAVDAEGKLWVPHWGGGAVVRCIIVK